MLIEQYINLYNEKINPATFFTSVKEVVEFIHQPCTIQDLQCFLERCEQEECYEYCLLIQAEIDRKILLGLEK